MLQQAGSDELSFLCRKLSLEIVNDYMARNHHNITLKKIAINNLQGSLSTVGIRLLGKCQELDGVGLVDNRPSTD